MHTTFSNSSELLDKAKWVTDFDPGTIEGAAERHILLHQKDGENAVLTGWSYKQTCLQRFIKCVGPVGSSYLIDSEDLQQRCRNNSGFKDVALRLSRGKSNYLKVEPVKKITADGKAVGYGSINVATYPGTLKEFHNQEILETVVAVVEAKKLLDVCRQANAFSRLRTDKCERHFLLRIVPRNEEGSQAELIEMYSAEPNGRNGFAFMYQYFSPTVVSQDVLEPINLCIYGRFINHICGVGTGSIEIRVDSIDSPTRVQFAGDLGVVTTTPDLDAYATGYLTKTAIYNNHGHPEVESSVVAQRSLNADDFLKVVDTQRPKKTATRLDLCLAQEGMDLVIFKASDVKKTEQSSISNDLSDLEMLDNDWQAITANYLYLVESIKSTKSYIDRGRYAYSSSSSGSSGATGDEWDFDVDETFEFHAEEETEAKAGTVDANLIVSEVAIGEATDRYLLMIEPRSLTGLRMSINALSSKLITEDDQDD